MYPAAALAAARPGDQQRVHVLRTYELGYRSTVTIGDDEKPEAAGDIDISRKVIQLTYAGAHACALLDDVSVRCWGSGSDGQLGYGSTNTIGNNETPASAGPVQVGGTVTKLAAGASHTCALLSNGSVRCWGLATGGRLGYGNTASIGDHEPPDAVGTVDIGGTAIDIAAGDSHTCALLSDKTVRCWGDDRGFGLLGQAIVNNIGDDEIPASVGDVAIP